MTDWGSMTWLADDNTHAGLGVSLARMTVNPGKTSPAHFHNNANEVIYVIAGRLSQRVGDTWLDAGPGDTMIIPKETIHQSRCIGDVAVEMMISYSTGRRHYDEVNKE